MCIGRLDNGALVMTGIGLCVPLTTIITAFNGLFRRGGAPLSFILLGEGKKREANHILTTSFICLILPSLMNTFIVWLFQDQLLYSFGADDSTICKRLYVCSFIRNCFIHLTIGLNDFINVQGHTQFSMLTVLIGGTVLNII